jgi:perosamine synthetase
MMGPEEEEAVLRVLRSGVLANGKESRTFEQEWLGYLTAYDGLLVSNGTTALQAALMALAHDNPYQKDVLVPAMSFNATSSAVLAAGLNPVFVDISRYSNNIDPKRAKALIRKRSTLGLIAVDLYGLPANYEALSELGLPIIQDAAQSHGAFYEGYRMGSHYLQQYYGIFATTFSFYATKNITTGGEGGFVIAPEWETVDYIHRLREHGQTERYHHDMMGYNWRVTEMQAAIGREQLKHLDEWQQVRQRNANYYDTNLHLYFDKPYLDKNKYEHGWHQYVVRVVPEFRDPVRKYMDEHGVGTGVHYPVADPRQPMYDYPAGSFSAAESLAREAISLPVGPWVTEEDAKTVVSVANDAIEYAQENWDK